MNNQKRTVLVIDPYDSISDTLKYFFKDYVILSAETISKGFIIFIENPNIDTILLDCQDFGINEIKTIKILRRIKPSVKVIVISISHWVKKEIDSYTVNGFLEKPFDIFDIKDAITLRSPSLKGAVNLK